MFSETLGDENRKIGARFKVKTFSLELTTILRQKLRNRMRFNVGRLVGRLVMWAIVKILGRFLQPNDRCFIQNAQIIYFTGWKGKRAVKNYMVCPLILCATFTCGRGSEAPTCTWFSGSAEHRFEDFSIEPRRVLEDEFQEASCRR